MPPNSENKESKKLLKTSDEESLEEQQSVSLKMRILSSLFYAIASSLITVVNKVVLTTYQFPSFQFLAFGQIITTVVVLYMAKQLGYVSFPNLSLAIYRKIYPLQFLYIGNTVSGLGSTQNLNLPMFTVLRRISILMTMVGEYWIFKVMPSYPVQISVYLMIIGAVIAGLDSLAFNLYGYICVMVNNFFTAGYGVIIKLKLDVNKEIGKYGLLYYCALFTSPISFLVVWLTGDLDKVLLYPDWLNVGFLIHFSISCIMGFVLMYSVSVATQYNSALTVSIVGCLKNVFITYAGMFIGGDYIYSLENFIGINISVIGSIVYTYIEFRPTKKVQIAAVTKT